jgi:hypothetical protein
MWTLSLSSATWYRHTSLTLHKECRMLMCVNLNRDVKVVNYGVSIYPTYVISHMTKRNTFNNNNTKFWKLLLFIVSLYYIILYYIILYYIILYYIIYYIIIYSFIRDISVNKSRIRIIRYVARMGDRKRQWL